MHAQSLLCLSLCDAMDYKPSRFLCPWDSQERILQWVVISFSRGSPQHRDQTHVSHTDRQILHHWVNWKVQYIFFSSVQSLSCVRLFATPWIAARQASLSITNSRSSLKLMSIESVMPSSHLILCRSLLLLPPIPAPQHQSHFQWINSSHEVAKVLEFQL